MLIYAHRGARAYAPENTMSAFRSASILKADGIELDVQMTKDNELIICHDHTVNRTSNGSGWLRDLTLQELKRLDFGSWFNNKLTGEPILPFAEFFTWYVKTPLLLNIEIKNGPVIYQNIEQHLIDTIKNLSPDNFNYYNRIIISSFYHPSLCKIKTIDSHFKTGVLFSSRPVNVLEQINSTNADYLHSNWQYLDCKWVDQARNSGIGINCYTINNKDELAFINRFPLTGIFSDYPDCCKADKAAPHCFPSFHQTHEPD